MFKCCQPHAACAVDRCSIQLKKTKKNNYMPQESIVQQQEFHFQLCVIIDKQDRIVFNGFACLVTG